MKYVTIFFLTIFTVLVIVFGQSYWSNQIEQTVAMGNEKKQTEPKKEANPSPQFEVVENEELKSALEKGVNKHKKANILIAGSKALGDQDSGLGKTLSQEIKEEFEDGVTVSHIEFTGTSSQLIEEGLINDYQETKPDVLILEGLTLADNGNVAVEDNHENIATIIEELKSMNEDIYVILMPTHPIPNAKIYPKQVDALKEFAAEENITYIDHWEAWPDYKNEAELMEYLEEDKTAPNDKGIEIWSKEVLKLFGI